MASARPPPSRANTRNVVVTIKESPKITPPPPDGRQQLAPGKSYRPWPKLVRQKTLQQREEALRRHETRLEHYEKVVGDNAAANTYPYISVRDPASRVEHEASTSKIGEEQLFYFQQRGIDLEEAVGVIISGFCKDVFRELPLEFAAEVSQLMSLKLENAVG